MSAFTDKLLAPTTTADWLDRRAGIERAAMSKAEALAFAQEWLKKNHPRFGGQS